MSSVLRGVCPLHPKFLGTWGLVGSWRHVKSLAFSLRCVPCSNARIWPKFRGCHRWASFNRAENVTGVHRYCGAQGRVDGVLNPQRGAFACKGAVAFCVHSWGSFAHYRGSIVSGEFWRTAVVMWVGEDPRKWFRSTPNPALCPE